MTTLDYGLPRSVGADDFGYGMDSRSDILGDDEQTRDEIEGSGTTHDDADVLEEFIIQSRPIAEAVPEVYRYSSVVAFTTEVEYIPNATAMGSIAPPRGRAAGVISVRILKESTSDCLGITFRSILGELAISSISPSSPLANSPLRAGYRVISLDTQNVSHWTDTEATNYFEGQQGLVSIVVNNQNGDSNIVDVCVYKPIEAIKIGITFESDCGLLRVHKVNPACLIGEMSAAEVGDFLESINSVPVQNVCQTTAHSFIQHTVGLVWLRLKKNQDITVSKQDIVMTNQWNLFRDGENMISAHELDVVKSGESSPLDLHHMSRPRFISACVRKPTFYEGIGISFENPSRDSLTISQIVKQSPFSNTPLSKGCVVHSVNDIPCLRYNSDEARKLIESLSGLIRIVAQDLYGDASCGVAMAYKPKPSTSLGISISHSDRGTLSVHKIQSDSIFCDSVLNEGDDIIAINHVRCEHMQPKEACALTQRKGDSALILFRVFHNNAIVLSTDQTPKKKKKALSGFFRRRKI